MWVKQPVDHLAAQPSVCLPVEHDRRYLHFDADQRVYDRISARPNSVCKCCVRSTALYGAIGLLR